MDLLGDGDQDRGQGKDQFRINPLYAQKFEQRKRREELTNLKYAPGPPDEETDEETEDEDGELLSPALDAKIVKTIAAIRSGDSRLYDPEAKWFSAEAEEIRRRKEMDDEDGDEDEDEDRRKDKAKVKPKPQRLRDVIRDEMLAKMGEDEDEDAEGRGKSKARAGDESSDDEAEAKVAVSGELTYVAEQQKLKRDFLASMADMGAGDEEEGTPKTKSKNKEKADVDADSELADLGLLRRRAKTAAEKEAEDRQYEEFIRAQLKAEQSAKGESLLQFWEPEVSGNGEIDENERFLRDFVMKRGWMDKSDEADPTHVPYYDDIVAGADADADADGEGGGDALAEDEQDLDAADDFERAYNFRHEDPDGYAIVSHARARTGGAAADGDGNGDGDGDGSLRRRLSTRREKRKAVKERKNAERKRREEELKRLKNLKLEEMRDRIARIREVAGIGDKHPGAGGAEDMDMDPGLDLGLDDGDFDPDAHDAAMARMFGSEYYDQGGDDLPPGVAKVEAEAKGGVGPVDMDVGSDGGIEAEDGLDYGVDDDEGDDWMGDTVVDRVDGVDSGADERGRKKGKKAKSKTKKSGFRQLREELKRKDREDVVAEAGAQASAGDTVLRDHLDEYYHLHHEDMIGDLPTRFRYRSVPANDYGLTPDEILGLPDSALTQYVSLKKLAPYRDGEYNPPQHRVAKLRAMAAETGVEKRESRKRKYAGGSGGGGGGEAEEKEGAKAKANAKAKMSDRGVSVDRLAAYGGTGTGPTKAERKEMEREKKKRKKERKKALTKERKREKKKRKKERKA